MGPDPKPVRPELVEGPSFSSRKEKEKNGASTSSARTEFGQALTGSPSINRFAKNSLNSRKATSPTAAVATWNSQKLVVGIDEYQPPTVPKIGRASCRERVCQYV